MLPQEASINEWDFVVGLKRNRPAAAFAGRVSSITFNELSD